MTKNDLIYLEHIQISLVQIIKYVSETSKEEFLNNSMIQDAVVRNLEVVGEATKRLSRVFRVKHGTILWQDMAGMHGKLIHDYIDVDLSLVYKTALEDVTDLLTQIEHITGQAE